MRSVARFGGLWLTVSWVLACAQPTQMAANANTTPQSAQVTQTFGTLLSVTVKDASTAPVQGVVVTFTAPAQTGPSGLFANSTGTTTAATDVNGVATASAFTANTHAGGPYNVTATATGPPTVNFALTNTAGPPTQMTANPNTTPQSTAVTQLFTTALSITVRDVGSNPVQGVLVTFTAPAQTGASGLFANSTGTTTATTDVNGVATASAFTANTHAGGPYNVTATATGPPTVNFALTNTAGPPTQMTANANTTPQSTAVTTAFGTALGVTVLDSNNNPKQGVAVTFTAPAQTGASGTFANSTGTTQATTDINGLATATLFTANTHAGGPYNVAATATGLTTVNFALTNTVGTAAQMTANANTTPQSAQVMQAFTTALSVTVKDAGSNPLQGVLVTFTAPAQTGASGTFANSTGTTQATTDVNGVATASAFTANTHTGGPYNVAATATGPPAVNFALTNTAGPPTQMVANANTTPQSAQVTQAISTLLSVTIKDAGSNPVQGVVVTFTAPAQTGASGTFANSTGTTQATTDVNGVATASAFTANTHAGGPYSLTATATGLTTVNFALTNTAGPPTQTTANTNTTPQSATVATAFATALSVTVTDANSNPVQGVVVTFTAPASGASGKFANNTNTTQATTLANGVATATAFTANSQTGPYNVAATATGPPTVNFALTNTAGTAAQMTANTGTTPQSAQVTQAFSAALSVTIKDSGSNPVQGVVVTFTAPAQTGASGTFTNSTSTTQATTDVNGVATASAFTANTHAGGPYNVTATATGVTAANFALTNLPGPAAKLAFTVAPAYGTTGVSLTAPVVQVLDANGNLVAGSAAVTISSTPAGVNGTLTVNAAGGVATFGNLVFAATGNYTLTAASPGLASAASTAITITPPLGIGTTILTPATRLAAFSQQLTATGGVLPYTWSIVAGFPAPGITLSTSGLLSGTPSSAGNYGFTVRVRDNAGSTSDQALTIAVANALTIASCPASNGVVGQPYSSAAIANGGTLPYAWTLLSGVLPPGLALNGQSGAVTGTPTGPGTFSVNLQVADRSGATALQNCGLTIAPPLSFTTLTVSDASVSSRYTQTLLASGGRGPYTWALTLGILPQGLTLSSNGVISGTPTQQGFFNFAITVTDSTNVSVQQAFTMNVTAGLIVGGCPASLAEVGFVYNSALVAQGGTPPYTWSVSTGTLPTGLLLNASAGTITGTPAVVGVVQLTFTTTDKASPSRTASKQCSIDVRAGLSIATIALSQGNTGSAYSDSVAVTGGVPPLVFSTTAGSLPPGISLDSGTGQFSGRPTTAGSFQFTVAVADNVGAQATRSLTITVAAGLTIPNCPTPVASVGQVYSGSLVALGGSTPYVWSVPLGTLPPGLTLDSPNSVIAGTPTAPGTFPFVLRVDDSAATPNNTTRSCSIQVNPATFTITSAASLPNALVGVKYTQTLSAAGGVAPYSWLVASGNLPASFSLDSTGVLSGTTTVAGTFNFTVQATDASGTTARQNITLIVLAGTAPAVTITGLSDIVDPATQPTFGIQLAGSYPADINGTVTLTVVPDSAVGVVDPAVQFANGGNTLAFTVKANSTTPVFNSGTVVALQTGTVAATIQLSVKLASNGSDVTPPNTAVRSIRIDRLAPRIVSMTVVRTAGGLEVHIVGFSTTREVTQGSFQFSVSGGSPLSADVSMSAAGTAWFSSQQSQTFGGQFALVQPFTLQGSVGTLTSVTVTLSNAQGTSPAATANF